MHRLGGLARLIRKVGFDPAKLKYIFITHQHFDHFAGVGRVKAVATSARIGTSEIDWAGIEMQQGAPQAPQGPIQVNLGNPQYSQPTQTVPQAVSPVGFPK